jgi:hypothetical protein
MLQLLINLMLIVLKYCVVCVGCGGCGQWILYHPGQCGYA